MARKATKRKAITRVSPRRGQSARLVEEKHIGLETTDWDSVSDYETAFRDTLRHYGYFYDTKTFYKWTKEWFKKHKKAQAKYITPLEPWRVSATVGSMCRMQMNGAKFEGRWAEWFDGKIQELIDLGKSKLKEKKSEKVITGPNRKSPAELVKDKTSDFIADQEVILDDWENAPSDYSMFSELQKIDAAYVTAKAVAEYYSPVRDEIALLVSKKDKELLEAYENMPVRKHSKLLKFLDAMVTDAEKYMATKKAVRKTRKKRGTVGWCSGREGAIPERQRRIQDCVGLDPVDRLSAPVRGLVVQRQSIERCRRLDYFCEVRFHGQRHDHSSR
jgi:hypothetical protein